jgi:hypothetical protein
MSRFFYYIDHCQCFFFCHGIDSFGNIHLSTCIDGFANSII